MVDLSPKGKLALQYIKDNFVDINFSLADLNEITTEKIAAQTLAALAKKGILTLVSKNPSVYSFTKNAEIEEKDIIDKDIPQFDKTKLTMSLFNANSLNKLKEIPDKSVDCIITDPPYFIDGMGNDWDIDKLEEKTQKGKVVSSMPVGMKFDPQQGIDLQNFMECISKEAYRILKPGGFYLSFSQARLYHRMAIAIENCGFEIRDMFVWKREGQAKAFSQDHFVKKMNLSDEEKEQILQSLNGRKTPQLKPQIEPIVLAQKPKEGTFVQNWLKYQIGLVDTTVSLDGNFPGTVMEVPKEKDKTIKHFTVKPVKLIEHLIKLFSPEGAVICDPFLGSGTTGIACLNTGRNFIGIELNPEYYQMAKERIEKHQNGIH